MDNATKLRAELLRMGKTFSVIGKRMRVRDNSYITRIGGNKRDFTDLYHKTVIILSEPFQKQVADNFELREWGERWATMVRAMEVETKRCYEVMFCEGWLID